MRRNRKVYFSCFFLCSLMVLAGIFLLMINCQFGHESFHETNTANKIFIDFVTSNLEANSVVDVDLFVRQNCKNEDDFYKQYLCGLFGNKKKMPKQFKYIFQNSLECVIYLDFGSFAQSLATEYLTGRDILLPIMTEEEFSRFASAIYELNRTPGALQEKETLVSLICSDDNIDFMIACAYLFNKKIRLDINDISSINTTAFLVKEIKDGYTVIRRNKLYVFRIILDDNDFVTGIQLEDP